MVLWPTKAFIIGVGAEHQRENFFINFNNTISYQQLEESRNSQKYNTDLIQRTEDVFVFANTADFIKMGLRHLELWY